MDKTTSSRIDSRGDYSLRELLGVVFRHRRASVAVFIVVVGSIGLWTVLAPPVYEVGALIIVKDDRAAVPLAPTDSGQLIINSVTEEDLNSEAEILRGQELIIEVLQSGILHEREKPPSWFDGVTASRNVLAAYVRGLTGRPTPSAFDKKVLEVERKLRVRPVVRSNVISISYRSRDPQWAASLLRALVARYLDQRVQIYRYPRAVAFFEEQTELSSQRLRRAEDALEEYVRRENLSIPLDPHKQAVLEKLEEFDRQLAEARVSVEQGEQTVAALRRQVDQEPLRLPTADRQHLDPAIEQIQVGLVALELRHDELIQDFGPSNRRTLDLEAQMRLARERLAQARLQAGNVDRTEINVVHQNVKFQLADTEATLDGARARAASLERQVRNARAELEALNRKGFVFERLQRELVSAKDAYLLHLKKQEESRISAAMDTNQMVNVSVVRDAQVPLKPTSPNPMMNIPLALVLGLIGGLATAFVREFSDHSIPTSLVLEQRVGLRHLGSIPETQEL